MSKLYFKAHKLGRLILYITLKTSFCAALAAERQNLHFVFIKMSIIREGKNISNDDNAEYVFEPTN